MNSKGQKLKYSVIDVQMIILPNYITCKSRILPLICFVVLEQVLHSLPESPSRLRLETPRM